ncbi:hypothetical protein K8354_17440 [Polaribacter litorisediminis]|uniref:hypothetical protein n=1 Tax=Polaribacter litorisediminis TaxID=1908341 RepID=UPI001CBBE234|nr:hypothetical protein [Polaribacter litorisediminis]UAM98044.1 hypothetical protein K8354_17440 [Polaribacter litorisediminis]
MKKKSKLFLSYALFLSISLGLLPLNSEAFANDLTQVGGDTVCITNDFAKDHCVAASDGTGDTRSTTVSVGPLCSGTATPV